MPSRVIRGEINASDSLSRVSMQADLTFRALIVAVDDYGRIDGRLAYLKAQLYPMRDVTLKQLDDWLEELAGGPNPPIQRYTSGGRDYIQLTGWEQHRGKSNRATSSKYPEPPSGRSAEIREIPGDPPESRSRESGVESRETRVGGSGGNPASPDTPAPRARARAVWPRLRERAATHGGRWAEHPGKQQLKAVEARLRDGASEADLLAAIDGYIRRNGTEARDGFDPMAHFTATTLFRPTKFDANVEASRSPERPRPKLVSANGGAAYREYRGLTEAQKREILGDRYGR